MARLTAKQEQQLKQLTDLRDAPDTPAPSRSFNISMTYAEAKAAGLLDDLVGNGDSDDGDDGDDAGGGSGDNPPNRGGFFGGS